jgi:hypothetical protein
MNCFKDQTGHALTKAQLNNKWDGIKKDWRIWKRLISETGVGWSAELGTISAPDEWWTAKIKVCFFFSVCKVVINCLIKCCYTIFYAFLS